MNTFLVTNNVRFRGELTDISAKNAALDTKLSTEYKALAGKAVHNLEPTVFRQTLQE